MERREGGVGERRRRTPTPNPWGQPVFGNVSRPSTPTISSSQPSTSSQDLPQKIISDAQQFSVDIQTLTEKLALAEKKISEQHEVIQQQNISLKDAADSLIEQHQKIETLEKIIEEGGLLEKVKNEKREVEEKYEKLRQSFKTVTGEFNVFMEELKAGVLETGDEQTASCKNLQMKLDKLSELVQVKFMEWTQSRIGFKTQIAEMQKVIGNLMKMLESNKSEKTAQNRRSRLPMTLLKNSLGKRGENSSSLPTTANDSNTKHGVDASKAKQGFFCLCTGEFSSKSSLLTHLRIFARDGDFKCHHCSESFVHYTLLECHLKKTHVTTTQTNNQNGAQSTGRSDRDQIDKNLARRDQGRVTRSQKYLQGQANATSNSSRQSVADCSGGLADDHRDNSEDGNHGDESGNAGHVDETENGVHGDESEQGDYGDKSENCGQGQESENGNHRESSDGDGRHDHFEDGDHRDHFNDNHREESDDDDIMFIEEVRHVTKEIPLALVKLEGVNNSGGQSHERVVSISGMIHGVNVKRREGFYCKCGVQFKDKKQLDAHLEFQMDGPENGEDGGNSSFYHSNDNEQTAKTSKASHEGNQGGGDEEGPEVIIHMIHPGRPMECVCGYDCHGTKRYLANHIRRHKVKMSAAESKPNPVAAKNKTKEQPVHSAGTIGTVPRSGGQFKCSYCDIKYKYFARLKSHMKDVHNISKPGFTRSDYSKHQNTAGNSATGRNGNIKRNAASAAKSKRRAPPPRQPEYVPVVMRMDFTCAICKKKFLLKDKFKGHLMDQHNVVYRCNSGNKEIECLVCRRVFRTWFQMQQHFRSDHYALKRRSGDRRQQ